MEAMNPPRLDSKGEMRSQIYPNSLDLPRTAHIAAQGRERAPWAGFPGLPLVSWAISSQTWMRASVRSGKGNGGDDEDKDEAKETLRGLLTAPSR